MMRKSGSCLRRDRRADLGEKFVARDDHLVVEVAALLREALVLDVQAGDAAPLVLPHRARRVELVAVAGIGIGDHRHVDGRGDAAGIVGHLRHGDEPIVGIAERRRRAGAGHVDRAEAGLRDGARGDAVVGAGRDGQAVALQQLPELPCSTHGRLLVSCSAAARPQSIGTRFAAQCAPSHRCLAPLPNRRPATELDDELQSVYFAQFVQKLQRGSRRSSHR